MTGRRDSKTGRRYPNGVTKSILDIATIGIIAVIFRKLLRWNLKYRKSARWTIEFEVAVGENAYFDLVGFIENLKKPEQLLNRTFPSTSPASLPAPIDVKKLKKASKLVQEARDSFTDMEWSHGLGCAKGAFVVLICAVYFDGDKILNNSELDKERKEIVDLLKKYADAGILEWLFEDVSSRATPALKHSSSIEPGAQETHYLDEVQALKGELGGCEETKLVTFALCAYTQGEQDLEDDIVEIREQQSKPKLSQSSPV
ncbi:hypothetical protein BDP27DRAFT_1416470 [Rhodocollybia butyracea]|uniref:Uncharacterized protein n=1 Tax=Rhodocollybia butyracea TaxID=206335 RepID=A0A9P5Q3W3_9AGAR|nr:hypothetical protein BDP27DRAFT_1416470 [Rhodocollybia butyracea]